MKSYLQLIFAFTVIAVKTTLSQCSFNMVVIGAGPVCTGSTNTLVASGATTYTWSSNAGGGNSSTVALSPSVTTVYTVSATSGTCTMIYPITLSVVSLPTGTISVIGSSTSCGPVTLSANVGATNIWTQKTSLTNARSGAVTFEIGGKAYLGTGFTGSSCLNDFWEYDPATNVWTQKANFPGTARYGAVGFSIGNKGYVGTGVDCSNTLYQDIWQYDPATNTWIQKNNFGGGARRHVSAFVIGSKGYIATGHDSQYDLNDFWEYDPTLDSWTQKTSLSVYRSQAVGFSISGKGYIGTGNYMGNNYSDLYEYNPSVNSWTTKASIGGTVQIGGAAACTLGNKAYLAGATTTNEFWEYTPASNTWAQKGYFAGTARWYLSAFSVNGKGYMGTGASVGSTILADLWEFNPVATYVWSNSSVQPSITVASSGTYSLIVSNGFGCSTSLTQSISITTQPTVSISGNTAVCTGQSTTLTASGASGYTWSTGANTTSLVVSPATTTAYAVSGENTPGCSSSSSIAVISNSVPVITVSQSSTLVCATSPVTFTVTGGNTYTWSTSANGAVITVNPFANAVYTVNGTSSGGCISSSTVAISTNSLPVISVSPTSATICAQSPVSFTASGAGTYSWSNGGGNFASVSYTPLTSMVYTISGTDVSNACINSKTVAVTSGTLPIVSVNSGSLCSGQSFTLIPSGASTYNYTGGSNIVSPTSNTNYSVTGVSSQGCVSSNVAVASLTVSAPPLVTVNSGTVCSGDSFVIVPSGATSYTISGGNYTVSPLVNTSYSITGSMAGCTSSNAAIATVNILSLPSITISGSSAVCLGNSAVLVASGANTFTWSTNVVSPSITIAPSVNTNYTVIGTNTNNCSDVTVKTIVVNAIPVLSISGNTVVCQGSPTSLLVSGSAITYTWNNGTIANLLTVSPLISTIYTVTGSNANACVNTATAIVFVNTLPAILASASSTNICSGDPVTLNASGAVIYAWSGGIQNNSPFYPAVTSSYTVTGTGSNGCKNTSTIQVVVNAVPVMTLNSSTSQTICSGETFTLYASGANIYNWTTGDITPKTIITPTITSTYQVTGTDANGCFTTLSYHQVVDECLGELVNTLSSIGIKLYPNPATSELIIKLENMFDSININIFNNLGQKLAEVNQTTSILFVSLADYPAGVYFVSINSGNTTIISQRKFIKVND